MLVALTQWFVKRFNSYAALDILGNVSPMTKCPTGIFENLTGFSSEFREVLAEKFALLRDEACSRVFLSLQLVRGPALTCSS